MTFIDLSEKTACFKIINSGSRINQINGNCIFIENCAFRSLSSSNGGAIYLSSTTGAVFVTLSLFEKCFATDQYGAVFYNVKDSDVVFDKTCSYYCYSSNGYEKYGQFGYGYVSSNQVNAFQFMSITLCSPFTSSSITFRFFGGNQVSLYSNSSQNKVYAHSGLDFTEGNTIQFLYSTISNNFAAGWTACMFYSIKGKVDKCNFCNNNSPDSRAVILINSGVDITISNSVFLNNLNNLFDIRSNRIYFGLINCTIDSFSYINSKPITQNIIIQKSQTIPLIHYQSAFCNAEIPYQPITISNKRSQMVFILFASILV